MKKKGIKELILGNKIISTPLAIPLVVVALVAVIGIAAISQGFFAPLVVLEADTEPEPVETEEEPTEPEVIIGDVIEPEAQEETPEIEEETPEPEETPQRQTFGGGGGGGGTGGTGTTPTPEPQPTYDTETYEFNEGYNTFALNLAPKTELKASDLLSKTENKCRQIYRQKPEALGNDLGTSETVEKHDPAEANPTDFLLEKGKAYIINCVNPATITIQGTKYTKSEENFPTLYKYCNYVGFSEIDTMTAEEYLQQESTNKLYCESIAHLNGGTNSKHEINTTENNFTLNPKTGYLVFCKPTEFTYEFKPGANGFAIDFEPDQTLTAQTILDQLQNCDKIYKQNPETLGNEETLNEDWTELWQEYSSEAHENFEIKQKEGYYISCTNNDTLTLKGNHTKEYQIPELYIGHNIISFSGTTYLQTKKTAKELLETINNEKTQCQYIALMENGTWEKIFDNTKPQMNNFEIQSKKTYSIICQNGPKIKNQEYELSSENNGIGLNVQPFQKIYAQDILETSGCTKVTRQDPSTIGNTTLFKTEILETYEPGNENNFEIETGKGYIVTCEQPPATITIRGVLIEEPMYPDIQAGHNLINIPGAEYGTEITNAQEYIQKLKEQQKECQITKEENGKELTYRPEYPETNFDLKSTEAYLLSCKQLTTTTYELKNGWNAIGLNIQPLQKIHAQDLIENTSCTEIKMQKPETKGNPETNWEELFETHTPENPNNFEIEAGKGYYLNCTQNSITIPGYPIEETTYPEIQPKYNFINIPGIELDEETTVAREYLEKLYEEGKNCQIGRWNNGKWEIHFLTGISLENFELKSTEAYMLECTPTTTTTYELKNGWNTIGLNLQPTQKIYAQDLIENTSCTQVARQDPNTIGDLQADLDNAWDVYETGSENNFEIEPGKGYKVYCTQNTTKTIEGHLIKQATYPIIHAGLNFINIPGIEYDETVINARQYLEKLAQEEKDCYIFKVENEQNIIHRIDNPNNNFFLESKEGYFVTCTQ
jgi:hypothetical protein